MSHDTCKRVSETDRPMSMHRSYSQIGKRFSILLAVVTLMAASGFAQGQSSSSHSMLANAQDLGPEDSSKQITTTVWLRQRNKDAFDTLVQQMYQKDSPSYHHWLTMPEYIAKFAPTENDAAVVRDFLTSHNLTVASTEKNNHYVMARGRVGDVENALNVQIHRFEVKGTVRRAPTSEPSVAGQAGAVVEAVQVGELAYSSNAAPAKDIDTGVPYAGVQLTPGVNPNGLFFSANCFRSPETKTFKTGGGGPIAVYSGNRYGANINSGPPNLPEKRKGNESQLSKEWEENIYNEG